MENTDRNCSRWLNFNKLLGMQVYQYPLTSLSTTSAYTLRSSNKEEVEDGDFEELLDSWNTNGSSQTKPSTVIAQGHKASLSAW